MTGEKEKWVNEVMQSAERIVRAEAPSTFSSSVMARIKQGGKQIDLISFSAIWRMAAVILVLIVLNISTYAVIGKTTTATTSTDPVESLASDYSLNVETTVY